MLFSRTRTDGKFPIAFPTKPMSCPSSSLSCRRRRRSVGAASAASGGAKSVAAMSSLHVLVFSGLLHHRFTAAFVVPQRLTSYNQQDRRHGTCDHLDLLFYSSNPCTWTPLGMVRGGRRSGGGGPGGGAGNNKKKKNSGKKRTGAGPGGKHRKTTKRDGGPRGGKAPASISSSSSSSAGAAPHNGVALPSDNTRGRPPWQVMSSKENKKYVQDEVERRERIRLGIGSPSEDMGGGNANRADVSRSNALLSESDRSLLSWKRFNPDQTGGMAYIGSYLGKSLPPSLGVPEVAFLGRSNVGKSSLLNRLTEGVIRKSGGGDGGRPSDRARVGKTPGATAAVNMYAILSKPKGGSGRTLSKAAGASAAARPILGLADLPGFGYARLSKGTKADVEQAAEKYLGSRRELALGVLLVDARRVPSADDRAVLAALYDMGVPIVVAATKVDKLSANALGPALEEVRDGLGLPDGQPLCISSVTGEGTKDLWQIVLDACETRVEELTKEAEGKAASDDDDDDEEEYFDDDDDLQYSQGYDWIQSFDDQEQFDGEFGEDIWEGDKDDYDGDDDDEESELRWKMAQNEERQAADNEALKLRNLRKVVRRMERKGEV